MQADNQRIKHKNITQMEAEAPAALLYHLQIISSEGGYLYSSVICTGRINLSNQIILSANWLYSLDVLIYLFICLFA